MTVLRVDKRKEAEMSKTTRLAALFALTIAPLPALAAPFQAVLYKNPQCGCCDNYVDILRQSGFEVQVKPTNNHEAISAKAGAPPDLEGCHTMLVDGYAFEGLVPVDLVKKVLTERPPFAGLTLPGMPMGAPGMPGVKEVPLKIYAFTKDGKSTQYAVE
jgi:hypothetical protein